MALKQLVTPTVIINNISYSHVVNSVEVDPGLGEQKMRAISSGGGAVEVVFSNDVSQNYSMVKIELVLVDSVKDLIEGLKENQNDNTISVTDSETTFHIAHAALLNKVSYGFGPDKNVSLEFGGDQVS